MKKAFYDIDFIPLNIKKIVMNVITESGLDIPTYPVKVVIGRKNRVKATKTNKVPGFDIGSIALAFRPTETIVELDIKFFIKYSQETIPFREIPLHINDIGLYPIMKVVLEKRLAIGE